MLFELDNVAFQYADGTVGLDGISGVIEAGERVAIVGANGSGKSTLLKALNGLIEPTSGAIYFEGKPLTEKSLNDPEFQLEFRSRVGFVFQDADAQLFNATVKEEIAFGPSQLGLSPEELESRSRDVMEFLGIQHLADRAPFRLSGGEKRKVAIGSVLAMNPDVILFDEPIIGLDPRSQEWLIRCLHKMHMAGKTIVIATHCLDTLSSVSDRAMVISEDHRRVGSFDVEVLLNDFSLLKKANLILDVPEVEGSEVCLN